MGVSSFGSGVAKFGCGIAKLKCGVGNLKCCVTKFGCVDGSKPPPLAGSGFDSRGDESWLCVQQQ